MGCHVNLNDPVGTKRPDGKLITRGEQWIVTDMTKKGTPAADARKAYDAMSYNERQTYAMENFEVLPGAIEVAKYPDGTPKPQFVHHGPELSGIGTKLTADRTEEAARAWLFDWLKEPRHYSDYTIMPRLRLSDQQAMDLAEYLLSMKRSNGIENDPWKAELAPADPDKLKELIALQLKSKYTLTTAKKRADSDDELNPMLIDALTTPAVPVDDAKKLAAEITDKDEKRLIILGKKMIANYGCMSCHMINGAETISSPCANLSDWGQKQVSKLDFGYLSEHSMGELPPTSQVLIVNGLSADAVKLAHEKDVSTDSVTVAWPVVKHLRQDWVAQKLKNTRIFDRGQVLKEPDPKGEDDNLKVGRPYDKLKMPTFYLNDEQVHAIVTFVLSNRDRLVSERLWKKTTNDKAMLVARGRELVQRYNCVSCHIIETNKPQVQQYFKSDDIMVLAPPSLRGEGNKIQHAWLFNFFKNVVQMRPRLFNTIRMPSFPATDEEWTAIIAYFNQASAKESHDLRKDLEPVLKYINEQKAAEAHGSPPVGVQPGDDWITRNEFSTARQHLYEWALTFNQLNELQLDPKQKPEDLARNYRLALARALFVMELYDAPYPFVEANTPEISEDRFKLGEQFFYQLQCLSCHVLGDPTIQGANKNPTAPNLTLAHLRLQRRWVRHWVQEPDIIQKGTAMPPFFTGLPIYATVTSDAKAPLGQSQPRAQNVPEPQATQIEEKYGKTVQEQTGLLLDFLYEAGARGYTAKQPVPAPTSKPASVPTTKPTG
jgi:mono/diheme cytochrome c family protein